MINLLGNLLLFIGAVFSMIASIGLYRLPGIYLKMHAATKAGTLGAGLILLGVAVRLHNLHTLTEVILLILFISITNPISAHLIAKVHNELRGLS